MDRIQKIGSHLSPKVAVLGAAGGIGQPLSLLLKLSPLIGELSLYDVANTPGVACDLSHISTGVRVKGYLGPQQLEVALQGCHLVIIPAGVPRKPGMTRDDLFNINASIVKGLCEAVTRACPHAWVAIISNPVNSTVPIAAEIFKRAGTYDPAKLFGVTTLDVIRAETFIAEIAGVDPCQVHVPVIGGHAGVTILPVLSQATPRIQLSEERLKALTARIQDAGTEVVQAKAGTGSATLSMAHAAARFAESCLRAINGDAAVLEYGYVDSKIVPGLPFFSSRFRLGRNGVEEFIALGPLSPLEVKGLEVMREELLSSIKKGVDFAGKQLK
ncbi:hypothetical protein CEUSTIGMA_g10137.t1 [Chlamydomonas eustigma]|uniref:Malate dehydrogenase n=1 Tax=Chlamydomonas eustigma TaxID=1157962 RepID=A0A250XI07_9CHLO|nr:hypothetical protein CEUSTIGMA_g10137.t1 [Chlamydomonas eustigma]|eukprot:GAX82711.1 hypothetical protein CEUSTIGMA_g10137.t1 [Chlamydomonas eustigma]